MESNDYDISKERTSDSGHLIKGPYYSGAMDGKNSQYLPSHFNHSDWLHQTTSSSEMFQLEVQHRSKRRLRWFWIATCVVASFLVSVVSSRTPPSHQAVAPVHTQKFNRTSEVQFDNYSLVLRGQRIFLQ